MSSPGCSSVPSGANVFLPGSACGIGPSRKIRTSWRVRGLEHESSFCCMYLTGLLRARPILDWVAGAWAQGADVVPLVGAIVLRGVTWRAGALGCARGRDLLLRTFPRLRELGLELARGSFRLRAGALAEVVGRPGAAEAAAGAAGVFGTTVVLLGGHALGGQEMGGRVVVGLHDVDL